MATRVPALGFIGTGIMGGAIARRLLLHGHALTVWNRTRTKTRALEDAGATAGATPREVAGVARFVLLCLTDVAAVEEVAFGDEGVAAAAGPDTIVVDHSSIRPAATRAFAERLRATTGAGWVDAPVSGGAPGAEQGTLAVMAGGEEADVDAIRPVVGCYAARLTRMGPSGAGQTTKLINQILVGTSFVALAEACRLARNAGLDTGLLAAALAGGYADSRLVQAYLPKMANDDMSVTGRLAVMLKDLDSVAEVARQTGTPMPLTGVAGELYRLMVANGHGDADNAALVRLFGDLGG